MQPLSLWVDSSVGFRSKWMALKNLPLGDQARNLNEFSLVDYCATGVLCVSIGLFSLLMYSSIVFNVSCPN